MIQAGNASGQYTITTKLGTTSQPGNWTTVTCSIANYSACPNQPVLEYQQGDLISVAYALTKPKGPAGSEMTYPSGSVPTSIHINMCFSSVASVDRSWRGKNKAYPRVRLLPQPPSAHACMLIG